MSGYSKARDQRVADEHIGNVMACRTCRTMTDHETLQNLGGMCHPCFQHYCNPEPLTGPPMTADEKREILARVRSLIVPGALADKMRAK